jgi:hypothetical protein
MLAGRFPVGAASWLTTTLADDDVTCRCGESGPRVYGNAVGLLFALEVFRVSVWRFTADGVMANDRTLSIVGGTFMSALAIRGFYRSMTVGLIAFAVGVLALSVAPAARAAAFEMMCTGTDVHMFNPGLSNTEQLTQFQATETFTNCPLKIGAPSNLNGGTSTVQGSFLVACTIPAVLQPVETTETYYWSNGSQSVVTYNDLVEGIAVDGTLTGTFTGTVTSGVGAGSGATLVLVLPDFQNILSNGCATPPGLTSLSGTVTLNLLGL